MNERKNNIIMSDNGPEPRTSPWIAVLFLVVLVCLFFSPLLSGKYIYFFHDLKAFYIPNKFIYAEQLKQGTFIFWNKLTGAGFPMHAEGQTGVFYPPNMLIFGLLPFQVALVFSFLLHYIWAAIGTYFLARSYGVSSSGSLFGALCFTFSGFMISHLFHMSMMMASSWTPWLFYYSRRCCAAERSIRDWLVCALSLGCMVLAGHPQIVFIALVALAPCVIVWSFRFAGSDKNKKRTLLLFGAAITIGLLLGAVQVLPTLEFLPHTARAQQSSLSFLVSGSFPPQHFLTLICPWLFGINSLPVQYMYENISGSPAPLPWGLGGLPLREAHIYCGLFPLFLVMLLMCTSKGRRVVPFEISLILLMSVILMLGKFSPLFFLWNMFPIALPFRMPVRFALIMTLAVAVLTGLGWDFIRGWGPQSKRKAGLFLMVGLGCLLIGTVVLHSVLVHTMPAWTSPLYKKFAQSTDQHVAGITIEDATANTFGRNNRAERIIKGILCATSLKAPIILLPALIVFILAVLFLLWAGPSKNTRWASLLLLVFLILDLAHFSLPYNPFTDWLTFNRASGTGQFLKEELSVGERFAVIAQTRPDYQSEMDSLYGDGPYISFCHPNYNYLVGIPNLGTPAPLSLARWENVLQHTGLTFAPQDLSSRIERVRNNQGLLRLCRVTHLVSDGALDLEDWPRVFQWEGAHVYRDQKPVPYFLVPADITFVGSEQQARTEIFGPSFNPGRQLVIEPDGLVSSNWPGTMAVSKIGPHSTSNPSISMVYSDHHRLTLQLSLSEAGFLVVPETYYAGWTAYQDGRRKPIVRANYLFMAVPVDQGKHVLSLLFQPFSITLGLFISLCAVCLLSLFFFLRRAINSHSRR